MKNKLTTTYSSILTKKRNTSGTIRHKSPYRQWCPNSSHCGRTYEYSSNIVCDGSQKIANTIRRISAHHRQQSLNSSRCRNTYSSIIRARKKKNVKSIRRTSAHHRQWGLNSSRCSSTYSSIIRARKHKTVTITSRRSVPRRQGPNSCRCGQRSSETIDFQVFKLISEKNQCVRNFHSNDFSSVCSRVLRSLCFYFSHYEAAAKDTLN